MTGSNRAKILLLSSFLVSIFIVGIVQASIDLAKGNSPQCLDIFFRKPTQQNLRNYETALEKQNWFSQQLQPWMRLFQYWALNETGDKTLTGLNNWFFYRPGVRYLIEPLNSAQIQEALNTVLNFKEQLNVKGIQLLVVPAPGKASVYPDQLTTRTGDKNIPVDANTRKVIQKLREQGVNVFDLNPVLEAARAENPQLTLYLPQDTHWSPQGLQIVAKSLASRIMQMGIIKNKNVNYKYKPVSLQRSGDILQMMNIPYIAKSFPKQELICNQVVNADSGELYEDDPTSPILIIGDSFLRIFEKDEPKSAGLISHLAYELKQPLASIVSDGGASTLVRQELAQKSSLLKNKQLLIWEFVERDIRFGTEGWQKVTLR